ncbi:hypothetical protein [Collinsella aerofaciens]|uniref:Uncharacterized protein n=1 Tax=Collinsella aerofaciens TaxID=74426 RepID=A0A6L8RIQ0_9ACTN|nr:hypothetical protein [Collinsella aerofaciens]MZJ67974.1 hypothetical protein [Collinsella aerofaciens]MZJ84922.1 hypothetical protein [Collinsella aerofaciens]
MATKYTDAPRTRVMTPAALNNGVHENHSIGQTMAIAPKKGLFDDISIPQIVAGAAAAATSVALASKIGIAGSVIGAAVSSVITVVSSQVYRHFISASAKALKGTHADVDYPAGAYEPVEFDAEEHLGGAATTQEMRQIAGRATTARVAPNSLRAKAAAERSQTQKKVIIFSIAIAIVAVIACTGAILITTAGEGLGERPEPILSSRTTESDADSTGQSQIQQDDPQGNSASTNSSSDTPDQSQSADSSTSNSGTPSGTTDSSQTTDGSQPNTGGQTSDTTSGTGTADSNNTNSSSGTASGTASDNSSQGTASGN